MSLASGTRLGPYEIVSPLGAGGMGEIYRARDTRLDRDVAIKVLPSAFAQDADRLARFEREAKAIAALSHPNILAIHDIGAQGGQTYVVTELLDGETLRDHLTAGAMPVRKAIDCAVKIARGLAAAHDKGLVHRDLKPENLFLLKDGQVKILDFGLAKTIAAGSGATETVVAVTDPGSVLGTVGYMAPEQVRGQTVDARADLFSFGAVLYEMVSGQRAFQRDTAADTLSAVLTADPPELSGTRTDLSPALDRIVRHSLEKNPNERFQTARDIAFALEALSGSAVSAPSRVAATPGRSWRRWAAVAVIAVVAGTAGMLLDRRLIGAPPTVTFEAKTFDAQWIANARFGSDGRTIVYDAGVSGNMSDVFVIRPGSVGAQPIGSHMHLLAVSSKDELVVLTDPVSFVFPGFTGTLARMAIGGAPRGLLEHVRDADFGPDGSQLAVIEDKGGHDRLEYPMGTVLYEPSSGYLSDVRVSRDGARVAFFEHHIRFDDRGWVKVADRAGHVIALAGEFRGGYGLAWSADGQSVWFSASDLGDTALQPHVVNTAGTPRVSLALPSAGSIVVSDVAADGRVLVSRNDSPGSMRALLPGASAERDVAEQTANNGILSRDGKLLLYSDRSQSAGPNYAVALRRMDGSAPIRLGEGDPLDLSPDARWALALVDSTDQLVRYPTGTGQKVDIDRGPIVHYLSGKWFPDGERLLLCGNEPSRQPRCYEQPMTGGRPTPITPDDVRDALISPDGRTLLLTTTSDTKEILVIGGAARIAPGMTAMDNPVAWSGDGRSVVVQAGMVGSVPARLERVDMTTGARTFVRELAPPERTGLTNVFVYQWLDDGRAYSYGYSRLFSTLFVASSVK